MTATPEDDRRPLCVDLDGTLIATDLLWESAFALIRARPACALRLPGWWARGRAHLKAQLGRRVALEPGSLPYRPEVLRYLREQKEQGRRLVLASSADERLARAVADHTRLFDEVIASDGRVNLVGEAKLRSIEGRWGRGGFDYMGDSGADLPLWRSAGRAIIVHPSHGLLRRARAASPSCAVIADGRGGPAALLRLLRPHQWAKNVLLAVPLLTSHQVGSPALLALVALAFVAFSLVASAGYVLNDLLDYQSDRRHPTKRRGPLASGQVSMPAALGVVLTLLATAAAIAQFLPAAFRASLLLYLGLSLTYSLYLKQRLLIDVICLAWLYTHRIVAGGAVIATGVSPWLMAFAMFFFLSLAFVKRYTELAAREGTAGNLPGRSYAPDDLELIRAIGPASGYICVLVFCLYINGNDVLKLYRRQDLLWCVCPILLYWITRVWFLAHRRQLHDDPVIFALKDRKSYLAGALIAALLVLSS